MEAEQKITVSAGTGLRLEFDREVGRYGIFHGGTVVIENASGWVSFLVEEGTRYEPVEGEWRKVSADGASAFLEKDTAWGRMLLRFAAERGAILIGLGVVWEGKPGGEPRIDSMSPLSTPPGAIWPGGEHTRKWRAYVNGWQCWSPAASLRSRRPGDYLFPLFVPRRLKAMLANPATVVSSERGKFESEWFGGIADLEREQSVVVGFTGLSRALSQVSINPGRKREDSRILTAARFEGRRVVASEEFSCEELAVIYGDLSGENLETYADLAADRQSVGEVRGTPPGWCSWYQYFTGVTRGDVEDNLRLLSGDLAKLGIEVVQVDDGYQSRVGDWLDPAEGFEDLESLAGEISRAGKLPGVWLAPFTVHRRSRLFRERKEWLLVNRKGKPVLAGVNPAWRGRYYGLDLTNPEVLRWIRGLFETFRGFGYRFFKLDFMACGLLEGVRHDSNTTRAQAARRALEIIREAVGEDSYLIAAGGPVLLGAGILDAQRLGPDIDPAWSHIWQPLIRDRSTPGARNCLHGMLTRCFLGGRLFEGDPDCVLLRGSVTRLDPNERRTLASAASVLGGSLMFSDDLGLWGADEVELAARVVPPVKAKVRCPDLWEREVPRYLVSRLEEPGGGYYLVWMVNWAASKRSVGASLSELGVEPGRYHACEFWKEEYQGKVIDEVVVRDIPGHGSAVVKLTPEEEEPRLIGSNIHVTQGAAELVSLERVGEEYRMVLRSAVPRDASVVVSAPEVASARLSGGGEVPMERIDGDVHRLSFRVDGEVDIIMGLKR
jgi:alpha-galactosidase